MFDGGKTVKAGFENKRLLAGQAAKGEINLQSTESVNIGLTITDKVGDYIVFEDNQGTVIGNSMKVALKTASTKF